MSIHSIKKSDLISIIVPVYNVEQYIDKCLTSIITQTYSNLEIILVNDGSTDNSRLKCENWAMKDSRIKVIHKENEGLSEARNIGINNATGNYLTFIDSDDYILESYISHLYDLIIQYKADLSVCQPIRVDEENQIIQPVRSHERIRIIEGNSECMKQFLSYDDINTVAWGKLYSKKIFADIRYPKGKYHEDVWTTYKYIARCNSIIISTAQLYAYRLRYGSIVNSYFSPKHLDGIKGSIERYEYISKFYSELSGVAAINIIYSANQCMLRLGKSTCKDSYYINYLQNIYKKYLQYYLMGTSKPISKIFALIARYHPKILLKTIKLLLKK